MFQLFGKISVLDTSLACIKSFHTTSRCSLIQKWRKDKGLPLNPNAFGLLTDKPDYTYLDGRPTPLGIKQKDRLMQQQVIASKVIEMSKEMDFAVERHKQKLQEEQTRVKSILENKLTEKGNCEL